MTTPLARRVAAAYLRKRSVNEGKAVRLVDSHPHDPIAKQFERYLLSRGFTKEKVPENMASARAMYTKGVYVADLDENLGAASIYTTNSDGPLWGKRKVVTGPTHQRMILYDQENAAEAFVAAVKLVARVG